MSTSSTEPPADPARRTDLVQRTRLVLIRHGQSRATVDRVAGGERGCRGLTDVGIGQVEALRDRLVATGELRGATVLMSSTLPRARETAEILAPALGGLDVIVDRDLCEMHPGEGDGLTWEQWAAAYESFQLADDPYRPLSPGGESWSEFQLRVGQVLHRLVTGPEGGTIVVACHGGIIEGSMRVFLGMAWPGTADSIAPPANASLTEWLGPVPGRRGPRAQLVRYNDAAHVQRLSTDI